jgi:histidinol-phosphate aminotransferase
MALGPRFEYDADAWVSAVKSLAPSLVVLCLPNNPTGTEMSTKDVRRVAEATLAAKGVLVVDEAYREFSEVEFDRTRLPLEFPNIVLVRTCSKAFAAAGLRLGYCLASAPLAAELRKMVPPFHLNLFAAVFGSTVWERKDLFLDRVKKIVSERDRLMAGLARVPGVRVFPTHANFFLARVRDAERLFQDLKGRGILVRAPGRDPALEGCLRMSAGTPEENDRVLAAVAESLGKPTPGADHVPEIC